MAPMMDTTPSPTRNASPTTISSATTTKPPDSTCSSWHPQVYRTLSLVFDFSNTDQKLWWHSTAPMFALMLQTANLGVHDQYKHLGIYKKHVIPFLGPYPSRTAGSSQDRWLSILTRYGIPFELSLNCSDSVVRYTYEPISEASGTETDPYNTLAIWDSLSRLVRIQPGSVHLEWFRYFKKELTLDMLESAELRRTGQAEGCIKTQNKLALDLKRGRFAVKVYIYPALKALVTARSMYDLIFGSVRKLALEYPGIRAAFDMLDEYVLSREAQISEDGRPRALQPRLLSCDLVGALESRIKIYLLEQNVSLASLIDLWTLGGRRTDQATMDGLDLVCQLWDLLKVPAGWREYPAPYLPLGQLPNELLPFMANYTLHPDDDVPEPQVYFTVFGMNDSEVTTALTHFFERRGWTDMATKYERFLRESYPHDDFQSLNYLHTYISFSYRNNKPYLSVYLHSFESGNWPVFGESPTLFDAHRLPCKKVAMAATE